MHYFYGEDTLAAREAIGSLAKQEKAQIVWLDKEELADQSLGERLGQGGRGLFGKHLFVVRDGTKLPAAIQHDILQAAKAATTEWVLWDREAPDKRSKLFKTLRRGSREFSRPERTELIRWSMAEAQKRGTLLNQAAASLLIERVGSDRWRILSEIERLSLMTDTISREEIEATVVAKEEAGEVFAMLDALVQGNRREVLRRSEELLQAGNSEFYVLSMLAYQFKILWMLASGADAEVHEYVRRKNMGLARKHPAGYWLEQLSRILATDFSIKQGKVDARTGLTMLLLSLAK